MADEQTTTLAAPAKGDLLVATTSTTIKPGWRSSEFWLTLAVNAAGAFMASGLVADGSVPMRIAGMAVMVLGTLGYQVSRGMVKAGS